MLSYYSVMVKILKAQHQLWILIVVSSKNSYFSLNNSIKNECFRICQKPISFFTLNWCTSKRFCGNKNERRILLTEVYLKKFFDNIYKGKHKVLAAKTKNRNQERLPSFSFFEECILNFCCPVYISLRFRLHTNCYGK